MKNKPHCIKAALCAVFVFSTCVAFPRTGVAGPDPVTPDLAESTAGRHASARPATLARGLVAFGHPAGFKADLRLAGNRLVLELENNGNYSGTILVTIELGTESEISELGSARIDIVPERSGSYLLATTQSGTDGGVYLLTIRDDSRPGGRLLLYQHARLRQTTEPPPSAMLALIPPAARKGPVARSAQSISLAEGRDTGGAAPSSPPFGNFIPSAGIQLQARILTGSGDPPTAILSLDLYAERRLPKVEVEIRLGNFQSKKTLDVEHQSNVSFDLPAGFENGEAEPVARYRLIGRDRRPILEGELVLASLIGSDSIALADLRTDRPSYQSGDSAMITLLLDGRPQTGINIELSFRDEKGQIFQNEQRQLLSGNYDPAPNFTVLIPSGIEGPVTLEYRILDIRNGRLHDAGQHSIIVKANK